MGDGMDCKKILSAWTGRDGKVSFSKLVVTVLLLYLLLARDLTLPWGFLLVAASFGRHTVEAFFASKTITVNRAEQVAITMRNRDPVSGVDPT